MLEPPRGDVGGMLGHQVETEQTRVPELIGLRHARMSVSPFTFYRGTAIIMARDLANTPRTGIEVQCVGDAHIGNFGIFASHTRHLVFDINDFDETAPVAEELDLKAAARVAHEKSLAMVHVKDLLGMLPNELHRTGRTRIGGSQIRSINTIAQMAGVSRATVSRYLNDGYVSQEKRAAIKRVIDQTGYVPSRQAKTLRTGKTAIEGTVAQQADNLAELIEEVLR